MSFLDAFSVVFSIAAAIGGRLLFDAGFMTLCECDVLEAFTVYKISLQGERSVNLRIGYDF